MANSVICKTGLDITMTRLNKKKPKMFYTNGKKKPLFFALQVLLARGTENFVLEYF